MAIYYIDIDDEITSAAAKIRDSSDTRLALVVQGGSRVATSRINFLLLARESRRHGQRLAIIAADPSVRSLAQAAGLPVFSAVSDYQRAEAGRPPGTQPGGADAVDDALDELAATVGTGGVGRSARPVGGAAPRPARGPAQPAVRSGGRGSRTPLWLAFGLVAVLILVAGLGAFLLWPSATIVLTLREEPVGPINLAIKVDPGVTAPNDSLLTVPGVSQQFAATASGTFTATGQTVVDTAATGTVTFMSGNTGSSVTIPAGTQVETAGKLAFATTSAITVPKARVGGPTGLTLIPATADVSVTAVKKGLAGNVAAGAIVNVPAWLATALVVADQVTNKTATSGGTHTVTPFVQQSDLDAAEASLAGQLTSSLQAKMTDPASVAAGFELFPSTAQLGDPSYNPDPATLLNGAVSTFDLAATATGTATAANLATVRGLAERKIVARVQDVHTLVDGSVAVTFGSPTAGGALISVPVTANAFQAATVDVGQLRAAIKGMSVADAKAYLSQFGSAEVSISPFWASTISSFDFRIDLQVVSPTSQPTATTLATPPPGRTAAPKPVATPPGPTPTAGPTGTAGPTPTAGPTATGAATSSPSASPVLVPTPTPSATATSQASPTATP
jgi:hypothetical protein